MQELRQPRPQGANTSISMKTTSCMGAPKWGKDEVCIGRPSFKVPVLSFITCITLDKPLSFLFIITIHENMKTFSQSCCETQIRYNIRKNYFFKELYVVIFSVTNTSSNSVMVAQPIPS